MALHKTKNNLAAETRAQVCVILNSRLAELIDLHLSVMHVHWNIRGPNFIALHKLTDDVAGVIQDRVDEVAERVVQLGGTTEATTRRVARSSSLPEFPTGLTDGPSHLSALTDAMAATASLLRADIDRAAQLGDAVTADLLTGVTADLDKQLWLLEAHSQANR